ncbi:unnamed protein product [Trichogramma brassicae]|uniref:Uncharacterized protein n=1 Tax=Trichogramma brassicae TaxID=86971 RepID=A0A6H5IC41_9HYME|nr:unnamed protein product [Trichogramma brassicae]
MFGREIEIKTFSKEKKKDDSRPIMDKSPKIAHGASTETPNRPIVKDITESESLFDGSPDHCYISWSDKTQKEITKSHSVVRRIPLEKFGDISFLLQRNKLIEGQSLPDSLPSSRQSSSDTPAENISQLKRKTSQDDKLSENNNMTPPKQTPKKKSPPRAPLRRSTAAVQAHGAWSSRGHRVGLARDCRDSLVDHDGYLIAGQRFCGLAAASYVCKCTVVVINCLKKHLALIQHYNFTAMFFFNSPLTTIASYENYVRNIGRSSKVNFDKMISMQSCNSPNKANDEWRTSATSVGLHSSLPDQRNDKKISCSKKEYRLPRCATAIISINRGQLIDQGRRRAGFAYVPNRQGSKLAALKI